MSTVSLEEGTSARRVVRPLHPRPCSGGETYFSGVVRPTRTDATSVFVGVSSGTRCRVQVTDVKPHPWVNGDKVGDTNRTEGGVVLDTDTA